MLNPVPFLFLHITRHSPGAHYADDTACPTQALLPFLLFGDNVNPEGRVSQRDV